MMICTTIGKLYYPTGTNGISNSYGFVDEKCYTC